MYLLYGTITSTLLYFTYKVVKYLFFPRLKTFEEKQVDDEYVLLCYRIKYEDDTEQTISEELTSEDFETMNEENPIKYVIIHYMFNNKIMNYITYNLNTEFPIYDVNVQKGTGRKLEQVLLNDIDVSQYIIPYIGPKDNFYLDKDVKIKLKDLFFDHPDLDVLNFDEGKIKLITNTKKEIEYDLPWTPMFKPYSGHLDNTSVITNFVQHNKVKSDFGFTIVPNNKSVK